MGINVSLVLVTYNPEKEDLVTLLQSIEKQVQSIFIVDNTPNRSGCLDEIKGNNISVLYLEENMGIAYAQNTGINKALEKKSDYIMLSDQDTVYPVNYVENMLEPFANQSKIAAIAPLFKDTNHVKANEGFIEKRLVGSKRIYPTEGLHDVFQVIASGKIIASKYLSDIGLMDENLFIDCVDLEWCWRARKKGYKIIGNANVVVTHTLGDLVVNMGFKDVSLRSPIRHYYMTRNSFYLALYNSSLNVMDRIALFLRSFRFVIGFPIISTPHLVHLKYVFLGFWHGIIGKVGKLRE
ncbi:MAG: glycosyltransferase family 2 protein [Ghiorsea sp.]